MEQDNILLHITDTGEGSLRRVCLMFLIGFISQKITNTGVGKGWDRSRTCERAGRVT